MEQGNPGNVLRPSSHWPITIGTLMTIVLFGSAVYLALAEYCIDATECVPRFEAFLSSSSHEIGDTLSGFAGATAFIWLIVAIWLQKQEFAFQIQEMGAAVEAAREQASALADANKHNKSLLVHSAISDCLYSVASMMLSEHRLNDPWLIAEHRPLEEAQTIERSIFAADMEVTGLDHTFIEALSRGAANMNSILELNQLGIEQKQLHHRETYLAIYMNIQDAVTIAEGDTKFAEFKVASFHLPEAMKTLERFLSGPFWLDVNGKPMGTEQGL